MSEHETDFAVLHPDGRVVFGRRQRGERVLDLASRILAESLGAEVAEDELRLSLLTRRGGGTDSHQLWCAGLDSAESPDNVLLPEILSAYPRPFEFADEFPRWRGSILLIPPLDVETGTFPRLPDSARRLIDQMIDPRRRQPGVGLASTAANEFAARVMAADSETEMNAIRAELAYVAVERFAAHIGYPENVLQPGLDDPAVFERVVSDFLYGIAQLADTKGTNLDFLLDRGEGHFREERAIALEEQNSGSAPIPAVEPGLLRALASEAALQRADQPNVQVAEGSTGNARSFVGGAVAGLDAFAAQTRQSFTSAREWDVDQFVEVAGDCIGDLEHLAQQTGHFATVDAEPVSASLMATSAPDLAAAYAAQSTARSTDIASEPGPTLSEEPVGQPVVDVGV